MRFLEEGFAPSFFWELSLQEVYEVLASQAKKQRETMKGEVLMKYIQSLQIAECIAKTKDIKNEMSLKNIWDYYPSLFEEEKILYQKEQEEQGFQEYKQKRIAYARMHNARFGGVYE